MEVCCLSLSFFKSVLFILEHYNWQSQYSLYVQRYKYIEMAGELLFNDLIGFSRKGNSNNLKSRKRMLTSFFGLQVVYSNLNRYGSDIDFENSTVWFV